jgi:hypothetical protein
MTLVLNGTNGLSDVDGSAATPAIRGTDANTGIFFPAADTIAFSEGGTEAMRIDSSGNVGVGATPSAWGSTAKAVQLPNGCAIANTGAGDVSLTQNAYFDNPNYKYASTTGVGSSVYRQIDGTHRWSYAASGTAGNNITFTEAMRIDSSGNLLVGTTVMPSSSSAGMGYNRGSTFLSLSCGATTSATPQLYFTNGNGTVGRIETSGSSTSYITSSDYRLKENIAPMTGALAIVSALNPVTYKWKVDGSDGQGFIAHELQAVVPDCVSGEKDAVDADGNPQYQGIDTSFLVATLVAAIKEQQALITTLTDRITALEAKP